MAKIKPSSSMGRKYPNGVFYRRACKYMGIDPDNNPNYKASTEEKEEEKTK